MGIEPQALASWTLGGNSCATEQVKTGLRGSVISLLWTNGWSGYWGTWLTRECRKEDSALVRVKSVFSSQPVKGAVWEQRSTFKLQLLILSSALVNLNRSHNKQTTINLELARIQISFSLQVAHTATIYSHGFTMCNCAIHKLALICVMRHCQNKRRKNYDSTFPSSSPTQLLLRWQVPGDNTFHFQH